uniref:Mitochondrial carrier protein n=1 Tax=Arcella intermedia TaxID=1963864 RepID=A0A6B2LFI9_9EUKA
MDAFVKISRNEGILALWRGLSPTLMLTVPATTLYFTSYETLNKHLQNDLGSLSPLVAGAVARTFTATLSSPLEMIRTFLQSSNTYKPGILNIIRTLTHQKGISKLWTGLVPTLWRDVPFSAIYWTAYEQFRKHYFVRRNFQDNFISGACAGCLAATMTVPFDVLKTRTQMAIMEQKQQTTIVQSIRSIYKEEGVRAFFKGTLPRAARVAPACAIMIASYEMFKSHLRLQKHTSQKQRRSSL